MKQKKHATVLYLTFCLIALSVVFICSHQTNDLTSFNVEILVQDENPTSGTCCPSKDADDKCTISGHTFKGYYYKESGPCPETTE